jgi:hypothetical protein
MLHDFACAEKPPKAFSIVPSKEPEFPHPIDKNR